MGGLDGSYEQDTEHTFMKFSVNKLVFSEIKVFIQAGSDSHLSRKTQIDFGGMVLSSYSTYLVRVWPEMPCIKENEQWKAHEEK